MTSRDTFDVSSNGLPITSITNSVCPNKKDAMQCENRTSEKPYSKSQSKRSITPITLGFIAYFAVAAGPFGVENAVRAAGALPVLIAVLILPITWGLPQALMTAELSSMIDENGGYVLWVRRGLGEYAGWINAFNSIASNVCDLPTYPVLFCSYVEAFMLGAYKYTLSNTEQWLIKAFALSLVCGVNIVGMQVVGFASIIMSIFVLAPFLLEPLSLPQFDTTAWSSVATEINWSVFLSTILWNYQGWDSLGCVAGEVRDGGRAYPIGILIAICLITVNYAFPVATGIMVEPDITKWREGSLESIGMSIAPWLGLWIGASAVVATLGEFNVVMACSSRALWATANCKMLPSILRVEWASFGTPVAAILFQTITTAVLMSCTFEALVVIDTFFNNLTLLLEFCAYLRLKYVEPDTPRPYTVPFGNKGAWTITIPKVIVLSGVLIAQKSRVWMLCGSFNLFISAVYVVWRVFQRKEHEAKETLLLQAVSYATFRPSEIATSNSPNQ
uniref:Amino AcidPolyamineOrganocation (APC) Family putati n=1 Tax=Albugo laibachii Nc14 TaxID=890382 RepID=F0WCZ1_9STRA|nr:Amino AcidPolyamineOrganocation (APC) Family putati [Albugo laibachii Nc14]|eukprot:CCA19062.1 Amino AcidPolyamineOrganocation (APC) Family putati [Albugo laibachii Nc14]